VGSGKPPIPGIEMWSFPNMGGPKIIQNWSFSIGKPMVYRFTVYPNFKDICMCGTVKAWVRFPILGSSINIELDAHSCIPMMGWIWMDACK